MADHVVDDAFPPLEGNDDSIVLVASFELLGPHQHFDLVLVQDLNGIGRVLKPPHWCSVFLLVDETWTG